MDNQNLYLMLTTGQTTSHINRRNLSISKGCSPNHQTHRTSNQTNASDHVETTKQEEAHRISKRNTDSNKAGLDNSLKKCFNTPENGQSQGWNPGQRRNYDMKTDHSSS